MELVYQ